MNLPQKITAGDTVEWSHDAYANDDGDEFGPDEWTLKYYFRKASGAAVDAIEVVGTENDDGGWDFTKLFAASSATGRYDYTKKLVNIATPTIIKTIGEGRVTMVGAISASSSYDGRSQVRQDLEAVQAAMRAIIAGGAVQEYTIGSRQLKKMPMNELIELESKLKFEVSREERSEKIASGQGDPNNLYVRFRK